jgi:serine phosphatase RsbU (regulator of sigma subunit)/ABC-type amino acid transport substrate-binding protein
MRIVFLLLIFWHFSLYADSAYQLQLTPDEHKWIKEHPVINFTGDPNWLPFEAFNKKGEYIGIVADLLKLTQKRSGLTFNIIPTKTWEESVNLLKNGKVDMLTETTDSQLRSKFLFTQSFLPNPIVVIMQNGASYIDSLAQLKNKKIALIKEYGYVEKIKEKYPNHTFYDVENIQEGLAGVSENKYDAILTTMALGSYTIRDMQLSTVRVVGRTEFTTQLGFAINPQYAPLVNILNSVFKSIDEETKQNILKKWVNQEYVEKTDYTLIYQIAGIAFLIIAGTLFWNRRLKHEIEQRIILENKLAQTNKQITDSIEFAAIIQHIFIPEDKDLSDFFEDSFAIWQPRDIVGGDIYFFDTLEDKNKAILMVIDCTGHGVAGAFVSMLVEALTRNLIAHINQVNEQVSPAKLLGALNRSLKHMLKQKDKNSISNAGFDAAIVYIDKTKSSLTYAGANIPLFYAKEGNINVVKADHHSIGYKTSDPNYLFYDHHYTFDETLQFYLSTDGYIDQNGGEKGFPMGKKRLKRLLETHTDKPMQELQTILEEELVTYQGGEERNDDITFIGFRCKGMTHG